MAHYNEQQIKKIQDEIDTIPVKYVVRAIRQGDLTYEKVASLRRASDRLVEIQEALRTTPDEEEQQAWRKVVFHKEESDEASYVNSLKEYIAAYQKPLPPGNHVEEAVRDLQEISDRRAREVWDAVDKTDIRSLADFLQRHPDSSFAREADTLLWNLCMAGGTDAVRIYLSRCPGGMYAQEAESVIAAQEQWSAVRDGDALLVDKLADLQTYIRSFPHSPFIDEARTLFARKKEDLFADMYENMMAYDKTLVLALLQRGIVTREELFERGLASPASIDKLKDELNPVEQTERAHIESEPGVTDVFLFGIPSSGKTCVLTGLLSSSAWSIDFAGQSRDYMNYLITSCRKGLVPASTVSGYTTLIRATVKENRGSKVYEHPVNLVEMPGEDFLRKMVLNPDGIMELDDMGIGASELLGNKNPKALFIIVDPSASGLVDVDVPGSDESIYRQTISQDLVLRTMISLLIKNKRIMKYVDTINFIMTKADTIRPEDGKDRKQAAKEIIDTHYRVSVDDLISFCKENGINRNRKKKLDGHPALFLFSLGTFYPGGVYDYDSRDADALIELIKRITRSLRSFSWFDRLKEIFNR